MKSWLKHTVYIVAVLLLTSLLTSCGGGGGGGAGTGTLNLSLTDASDGTYKAVYVTINEVWVKKADNEGWDKLEAPELNLPQTLNLLSFVNGVRAQLGIAELEVGHYNQMRLILETSDQVPQSQETNILGHTHPYYNYVIDSDDNEIFLKVPSGGNTGIKIVNGFDIEYAQSTDIVLDFDAHKSIHPHPAGSSGEWRLRPTIKVVEINNSVSGVVDAGEDDSGVLVSAQTYDEAAIDFKDEVKSVAGTYSKEDGTYFMLLPINITDIPYNIVAAKDGFETQCRLLDSTASKEYTGVDFTLTTANKIGNVTGSVIGLPVPGVDDDYSVSLSIRKYVDCDSDGTPETMAEIALIPYVNDGGNPIDFAVTLPGAGEYEIVAWADGAGTYPPVDVVVDENGQDTQDLDLGEQIDFGF